MQPLSNVDLRKMQCMRTSNFSACMTVDFGRPLELCKTFADRESRGVHDLDKNVPQGWR